MVRVAIKECIEAYNAKLRPGDSPMSQAELARKLGVSQGAVNRWANGNRPVRIDVLARIAQELRCNTEDLIRQV